MMDEFLEEIADLEKAKALLEQVFIDMGPYSHDTVKKETWRDVCSYFNFDDSE